MPSPKFPFPRFCFFAILGRIFLTQKFDFS
nr:MAG TPA: hypothetical protein [Caudoviricetes sp.]